MHNYPSFQELKKLYPDVSFRAFKNEENVIYANMMLGEKLLPWVHYTGTTEDEVFLNVLKLWHWEKTQHKLPIPFEGAIKQPLAPTPRPEPKTNKLIGSKWVKEVSTGARSRLPADKAIEAVASGKFIFSGPRS